MPQYVFERVDKPSVTTEFFHHMNDAPSVGKVVTVEGVQWKRIFTRPQAAFDTKCDPYSAKDFVKATNKKGDVGGLWDRSKEMSLKRADKEGGEDPVRNKFFENYSRRRKGKKHPEQQRQDSVKNLKKQGIKLDWGSDD